MKIFLLLPLITALVVASCGGNKKQEEEKANIPEFSEIAKNINKAEDNGHNAQNSLDTDGTYIGLIANEVGQVTADTTIIELNGKLFKKTVKSKDKIIDATQGTIGWSEDGSTITLLGAGSLNKYFVGENRLISLDSDGNRQSGEDVIKYTLNRK